MIVNSAIVHVSMTQVSMLKEDDVFHWEMGVCMEVVCGVEGDQVGLVFPNGPRELRICVELSRFADMGAMAWGIVA